MRDAVLLNLQTLAESTQRLSNPLKAAAPDIPWEAIGAFRAFTHDYLELDEITAWDIERDSPALEAAVKLMAQVIASAPNTSRPA